MPPRWRRGCAPQCRFSWLRQATTSRRAWRTNCERNQSRHVPTIVGAKKEEEEESDKGTKSLTRTVRACGKAKLKKGDPPLYHIHGEEHRITEAEMSVTLTLIPPLLPLHRFALLGTLLGGDGAFSFPGDPNGSHVKNEMAPCEETGSVWVPSFVGGMKVVF